MLSFQAKLNLTPCKKERAESSPAGYSVLTKPDQHKYTQLYKQELGTKVRHSCCVFRAQAHLGRGGSAQEKYSADRLRMASIVDTNWQNFLAPDSDLPPDVVFLVKADGIERRFGAHRLFLAGVSPVFRAMLFGPMKETEKVVEVKDTTPQAFGTMIDYIYRAPDSDFSLEDIKCPQELFELLAVADRYGILNLVELTIEALEFLEITNENMIFAATVAQKYRLLHVDVLVDVSQRLLLKTKRNFPGASLDVLYELIDLGNETYGQPGAEYETLPKAQRTRGLSSSCQSHIASSNANLDRISSSES